MQITGDATDGEPVGVDINGRGHAGVHLWALQTAGVSQDIRDQGQNGEGGHEENAQGDHDFDQREGGGGGRGAWSVMAEKESMSAAATLYAPRSTFHAGFSRLHLRLVISVLGSSSTEANPVV